MVSSTETDDSPQSQPRRDFLEIVTWSATAFGAASLAWPFLDNLRPSADVLALASIEVDISPIESGTGITVQWRGNPVFVRNRTEEEVLEAVEANDAPMKDPQLDQDRVIKPEWLVVIGSCTHLGCVPVGNSPTDNRGNYGGWFCPCHGSQFDTSGRIRLGPAPTNLPVPDYEFLDDTTIKIG